MSQDNSPDMKFFVAPGLVRLTPAALALAKRFSDQIPGIGSGGWMVTFSWASARSISDPRRGVVKDLGPGLDLGAHRPEQVPAGAVHVEDGLKFALQIPREILAEAPRKIIDVDPVSSPVAVRLL